MQVLRAQMASFLTAQTPPPPPPPATPAVAPPVVAPLVAATPVLAPPIVAAPVPVAAPVVAAPVVTDPLASTITQQATSTGESGKFLGGTVQEDLRKTIREGSYVDLPLLNKEKYESKKGGQTKLDQPTNFLDWMDLYLMYMSIRIQLHPSEAPHLLAYLKIIKDLSQKEGGKVWLEYDRDFRKQKVSDTSMPWTDICFRLLYPLLPPRETAAPATPAATSQPRSQKPFQAASGGPPPDTACNEFYFGGWCNSFKSCTKEHICGHCHQNTHSLRSCFRAPKQPQGRSKYPKSTARNPANTSKPK